MNPPHSPPLKTFRSFITPARTIFAAAGSAFLSMAPASQAITLSVVPTAGHGVSSSYVGEDAHNHMGGYRGGAGSDAVTGPSVMEEDSTPDSLEGAYDRDTALDTDTPNAFAHVLDEPTLGRFADTGVLKFRLGRKPPGGATHHYLSRAMFAYETDGKNDFTEWSPTITRPEGFGMRNRTFGENKADVVAAETSAAAPKRILTSDAPGSSVSLFASRSAPPSSAFSGPGPSLNLASVNMLQPIFIPEPAAAALAAAGGLCLLNARRRTGRTLRNY